MPARVIVSARQERMGAELRTMREQAGLTVRQAARDLGIDQTKISHLEAGRVGLSEERLRRLAAHYACDDAEFVDALAAMATERHRGWWESYRDTLPAGFLDLAELEHHATFLDVISIVNVPGLLQTQDYARAVFSYPVPELSSAEVDARVAHRMRRQAVLDDGRRTRFVVHEAALRIMPGRRQTMSRQLQRIVEASTADDVIVRVVPFAAENFAGSPYSMLLAGGPTPRLDTVQLDRPGSNGYLHAEAQLDKYRLTFRKVAGAALDESGSRDLIHRLVKEL
jgi:transcriptional regulator with XRE-family HTH domain